MELLNQHQVDAIRKSFTQLDKHLTQEEVLKVMEACPYSADKRAADYFGTHVTSYRNWKNGRNKPSGRSKLVFNVILNMLEAEKIIKQKNLEKILNN